MRYYLLLLICILALGVKAQPLPSCVVADSAHLVFPADTTALYPFYNKIQSCQQDSTTIVRVLHIGGSHVQGGYLSEEIRHRLSLFVDSLTDHRSSYAGRGLLFPYQALKTNSPTSYTLRVDGEWKGRRNVQRDAQHPLGLSGAYCLTSDSAAAMHLEVKPQYAFQQLRLLGTTFADSIQPYVALDADTLFAQERDSLGWLFTLPSPSNSCHLGLDIRGTDSLLVRGLIPVAQRSGLAYTEAGINGATVPSWLRCEWLERDLQMQVPDLVIFGIGINDANGPTTKFDPEVFKNNYRTLVERLRAINPQVCLLFLTNNDCFIGRTRRFNANTPRVEKAFLELANELGGAVFNTYQVMGGYRSSSRWTTANLMRRDHIHFTAAGYQLVGRLISEAIMEDYSKYDAYRRVD